MSETESAPSLCFVDTNIWLYAFVSGPDKAKSAAARQLLRQNEATIVISSQVVNEVCVNLLKKTPLLEAGVRRIVRSFYEKYPVVTLDQPVQLAASHLRERFSLSFWDSLIVAAATHGGVSILYSEDMQPGLKVSETLSIVSPF